MRVEMYVTVWNLLTGASAVVLFSAVVEKLRQRSTQEGVFMTSTCQQENMTLK